MEATDGLPSIHLMRTHIIYKYPQPPSDDPLYPDGDGRSFRNWHRNLNNFAANHPIRGTVAVRAGYCLSDFTEPYSGMTRLVPGSHRLVEQLPIPQGSLDPTDSVELALQPGDAYLFSTSCYHFPCRRTGTPASPESAWRARSARSGCPTPPPGSGSCASGAG